MPNNELNNTIVLHPEHINSFTPESLTNLARVCGFEPEIIYRNANEVSLVAVYKKVAEAHDMLTRPPKANMPLAAKLVYA